MSSWAYIQSGNVQGGAGTSASASFNTAVGSGHVVCGVVFTSNVVVSSVTDDKGNPYTFIAGGTGSEGFFPFYGGPFTNGPTTITVTCASSSFVWVLIDEFAPTLGSGAVYSDGSNSVNSGSAQTSSGNFTTTHNGDLIYSVVVDSSGITPGSGFTLIQGIGTNSMCSEFMLQSTAGTTAGTWVGTSSVTCISAFALFAPDPDPLNQPSVFNVGMPPLIKRIRALSS